MFDSIFMEQVRGWKKIEVGITILISLWPLTPVISTFPRSPHHTAPWMTGSLNRSILYGKLFGYSVCFIFNPPNTVNLWRLKGIDWLDTSILQKVVRANEKPVSYKFAEFNRKLQRFLQNLNGFISAIWMGFVFQKILELFTWCLRFHTVYWSGKEWVLFLKGIFLVQYQLNS